ncbi:MAG: nicotinate (nicotinamide) nucleotide adenylyltransferase [Clostridia bacterium]
MKIGIFGGTFAPPHNAHKEMLLCSISQLCLDKVFVLPCGNPPHKTTDTPKRHRKALTELAFSEIDKVIIDYYEMNKRGQSYTLLTLKHYIKLFPGDELYLIIGGDSLRDFALWRFPQQIADIATLAVVGRSDIDLDANIERIKQQFNARIVKVNMVANDISSTRIRVAYQFNLPQDLVSSQVDRYIKDNNLYASYAPKMAKLRRNLDQERYLHSFFTTIAGLSLPSNIEKERVFLACALHDCAKNISQDEWKKYGFTNPNNCSAKVVHAELGAIVARVDYGITDQEILDAIKYHTTARANMTQLDKVVYIADKVEESREYPTKHLFANTLDQTFVNVFKEAVEATLRKTNQLGIFTQQAIEYYLKEKI